MPSAVFSAAMVSGVSRSEGVGSCKCTSKEHVTARPGQRLEADVCVIGGGLVGMAVAREVAVRGASVVLVEKEGALSSAASSGNSGLGHTGYDAPIGSLERTILRRAIRRHPALCASFACFACSVTALNVWRTPACQR